MKKEVIGHTACNICGHADAEVKEDKNGHAFVFCTDCAAQTFTRNDYRDKHLRRRMRPVTVTVTEPEKPAAPVTHTVPPVTKPTPPAQPAKAAPVAPVAPTPAPAPKKASWLQPVLAGGNNG